MLSLCPFCNLPADRILDESDGAVVIRDAYPVSPGHTLVVPKRHIGSFFDLEPSEQAELMGLLRRAKERIDEEFRPRGYNVGVNDGPAAGQTVPHVHIHLIPRYESDQVDPRGGVRWIFPEKADYWSKR